MTEPHQTEDTSARAQDAPEGTSARAQDAPEGTSARAQDAPEGTRARAQDAPEGIDVNGVTAWFSDHVPQVVAPLSFELITGGHSNLTFSVTDATGERWVLRRPPLGHVLATAHDMSREHRILAALAGTDVPVPPVIGLCTDEAVNGAPFYVMDFLEGTVVRNGFDASRLDLETRGRASESLIDVLCAIHAVDVDAVGLGDLGRREGYIERQLRRWQGQWEQSKTRELATLEEVHRRLADSIPPQGPATIVHGDYRLDNCMLAPDGSVAGVLDWEICTLGDPLADVGLLVVYWGESEAAAGVPGAATLMEGFAKAPDLLARYEATTGRDLSGIGYYVAFGYWKLACIIEGVYARYLAGAMGDHDRDAFAFFALQVDLLADLALARLDRNSS